LQLIFASVFVLSQFELRRIAQNTFRSLAVTTDEVDANCTSR